MASSVFVERSVTIPFRLPRTGKHSAGKAPKKIFGRHQKKLPIGHPRRSIDLSKASQEVIRKSAATSRQEFIATSVNEGNRIAKAKADKRTFRDWYNSLSPADQAFAREHKLHKPMPEAGFKRGTESEDALDVADREIIPESDIRGTRNGKPIALISNPAIDEMEPLNLSVEIARLSESDIEESAEDFGAALRWALSVDAGDHSHELVKMGQRSLVLIASIRPDLARGLDIDGDLARGFLESYGDFRFSETLQRLQTSCAIFDRVLEWMRRGTSLSSIGERLQLVAYELRPDLIDAATLEDLGSPKNKTRQAVDKDVNCLRDTFAGLRALVMRSDTTRLRCQAAQLA